MCTVLRVGFAATNVVTSLCLRHPPIATPIRPSSEVDVRYRIMMSMVVEARDDREAHEYATKLAELLRTPLVRMAVDGEGIKLSGDGRPVVHQPQREF